MQVPIRYGKTSTESLVRLQTVARDSVQAVVTSSCQNQRLRGMVDEIRECSDPVAMVVELAERDPDCLRTLLMSSLFVFEQLYAIQRQQAEIERRADRN